MDDQVTIIMRIVDYQALGLSAAFATLAFALFRTWRVTRIGIAALSAVCFSLASAQHVWLFLVGYFSGLGSTLPSSSTFSGPISESQWLLSVAMYFLGLLPMIVGAVAAAVVLHRLAMHRAA